MPPSKPTPSRTQPGRVLEPGPTKPVGSAKGGGANVKKKPAKAAVKPAAAAPTKTRTIAKAKAAPPPAKASRPAAAVKTPAPPVPKPVVLPKTRTALSGAVNALATAAPLPVREQKAALRKEIREALAKLRDRKRRSADLCEAIVSHPSWRRSVIVAIFAPMDSEPDVELLWPHAEGKTICYPTVHASGLHFIRAEAPPTAGSGPRGIREPLFDPTRIIPSHTFDLVLVPGAAFTANGDRLGRGGGFYDRLLASPDFRAFKLGVCFSRQVLETLPLEPHDQRVHRVVTESGWLQRPDFVRAGKPNA